MSVDPLNEHPAPEGITHITDGSYEYTWPLSSKYAVVITVYADGTWTAFIILLEEEG